MPSRLSMTLQGIVVSALTAAGGLTVWTKHCHFEPIDPSTDPTFNSTIFKRFNPDQNPAFYDVCVRRIPLTKVDYSLVKDTEKGGSKLVERFAQGIWGGNGYTLQRLYETYAHKNASRVHQLWTRQQLRESAYPVGTEMTDHFQVVDRPDPSTVLMRCGDSPLNKPDQPRASDGLFEVSATADFEQGFAEFRLKSIFYQGEGRVQTAPFEGEWFFPWAHRAYTRVWMETGVGNCKKGVFDVE